MTPTIMDHDRLHRPQRVRLIFSVRNFLRGFLLIVAMVIFAAPMWSAEWSIMPIGDSITYGAKAVGGYRYPLFVTLTTAGIGMRLVGVNTQNGAPLPVDCRGHNGVSGATIEDVQRNLVDAGGVGEMVAAAYPGGYWMMDGGKQDGAPIDPAVILLLIGTNDVLHHPDTATVDAMQGPYTKLITWLGTNRPHAEIIIGTTIPVTRKPARMQDVLTAFNAWLTATAPTWGPQVHLVDMHAAFMKADGSVNTAWLPDGVHPDATGCAAMATVWATAIGDLVSAGKLPKNAPTAYDPAVFALPTGRQSIAPAVGNVTIAPTTGAPGASITVTGTITAGNAAITAPVVTIKLTPDKGAGIAVTPTATVATIRPHEHATFSIAVTVPATIAPGTYAVGATAVAVDGEAGITFGPNVVVTAK